MNRKVKKIGKGILIGILLTIATLFTFVFVFLYFVFFGGPAKVTRDIKDYEEVLSNPYAQTGYIIFPEKIPEGVIETEFYNSFRDTWNSPTLQTYLTCVYDVQAYQKEIDRLEHTYKTYGDKKKTLLRDEKKKFQYPAYIAVENAGYKYEYALLTGKNQITYISTSFIDKENVKYSEDYLPYDFMTEEGRAFGSGYSIYYGKDTSNMIDTDYTRDSNPEVRDAHMEIIGDNNFFVRVFVDEQGREIIDGCAQYYYNPKTEEDKEFTYDDLNGMEYKAMEADREKNMVIVTYLDDGEEKTREYLMEQDLQSIFEMLFWHYYMYMHKKLLKGKYRTEK